MTISPFFLELRSAYQAELDDLTHDSEGRDVLSQRLSERRKELRFLLQMIELSPEMVAVIFHRGFHFKLPAVMDHLLTHEPDEFPEWDSLADALHLPPWAHDLSQLVLQEPMGEWFLTVAAGLEYMHSKPCATAPLQGCHDDEGQASDADAEADPAGDRLNRFDSDDFHESSDALSAEEAGAAWLVEQGFDSKE